MAAAPTPIKAGADKIKPLSMRALAVSYYNESAAFKALRPIAQGVYRNLIDRFCREADPQGQPYGDKSAVTIRREHVEKMMDARADRPDSANGLRKVLREMMARGRQEMAHPMPRPKASARSSRRARRAFIAGLRPRSHNSKQSMR